MYSVSLFSLVTVGPCVSGAVARSLALANQCGVMGYEIDTDAYYYDDKGSYAGFDECSQHCVKDVACKAIALDDSICTFFNVAVMGNFEADKSSSQAFWDRDCLSALGPTTTTSSTKRPSIVSFEPSTTTATTITEKSATSSITKSAPISAGFTSNSRPTSSTPLTSSETTTSIATSSRIATAITSSKSTATTAEVSMSSTTTTSASAAGVAVPSGCSIPSSYTITNFSWFNSSHNLDCVTGPDLGDGTGCIDNRGQWCDPETNASCTDCGIAVCSTGLSPQLLGHGPPDDVKFTFSDGTNCEQLNPAVVHRYEVGDGYVNCGSTYDFLNFYGSSNAASNTGTVVINGWPSSCADGDSISSQYSGTFSIHCTRDVQNNATCTAPRSINIPLVSYKKSRSN